MEFPDRAAPRLHLRAAAIALALVALVGAGELLRAYRLEHRYLRKVVAESCPVKDLGIVWQRECFAQPDILPLYGSSELVKRAPNKASEFFESFPSGFAVSPVGRPSCTSLILLEKIAASASKSPGRKVAICVSPSWFLARGANSVGFAGNFSAMQATELFYGTPLSLDLKRDIASQLMRYPKIVEESPVLALAVSRALARDRLVGSARSILKATTPLGAAAKRGLSAARPLRSRRWMLRRGASPLPSALQREGDPIGLGSPACRRQPQRTNPPQEDAL